jgi:hypothetical protein
MLVLVLIVKIGDGTVAVGTCFYFEGGNDIYESCTIKAFSFC